MLDAPQKRTREEAQERLSPSGDRLSRSAPGTPCSRRADSLKDFRRGEDAPDRRPRPSRPRWWCRAPRGQTPKPLRWRVRSGSTPGDDAVPVGLGRHENRYPSCADVQISGQLHLIPQPVEDELGALDLVVSTEAREDEHETVGPFGSVDRIVTLSLVISKSYGPAGHWMPPATKGKSIDAFPRALTTAGPARRPVPGGMRRLRLPPVRWSSGGMPGSVHVGLLSVS